MLDKSASSCDRENTAIARQREKEKRRKKEISKFNNHLLMHVLTYTIYVILFTLRDMRAH